MIEISQFFAIFTISQLLFALLLLGRNAQQSKQVGLYCLLMTSAILYLLPNVIHGVKDITFLGYIIFFAENLLPGIFYLTSLSVFSDHSRIKPWQYLLAVSAALLLFILRLLNLADVQVSLNGGWLYTVIANCALILDIALVMYALYFATKYWRDDLVNKRRIIRGAVISLTAVYIILVIFVGQIIKVQWGWIESFELGLLAFLITGLNLFLFKADIPALFEPPGNENTQVIRESKKQIELLESSMLEDKYYRQERLTIHDYSRLVNIQEYKLRALINGELGYRNFNDFLNHYRVQEVSEKLKHDDYIGTPILSIALESGFRSLSSFNKVFKETFAMTPSEYRKN